MSPHPADMAPEDFFALPVMPPGIYGIQPLRMREDKLGLADQQGRWWVYVIGEDGQWWRQQASPLRWADTGTPPVADVCEPTPPRGPESVVASAGARAGASKVTPRAPRGPKLGRKKGTR